MIFRFFVFITLITHTLYGNPVVPDGTELEELSPLPYSRPWEEIAGATAESSEQCIMALQRQKIIAESLDSCVPELCLSSHQTYTLLSLVELLSPDSINLNLICHIAGSLDIKDAENVVVRLLEPLIASNLIAKNENGMFMKSPRDERDLYSYSLSRHDDTNHLFETLDLSLSTGILSLAGDQDFLPKLYLYGRYSLKQMEQSLRRYKPLRLIKSLANISYELGYVVQSQSHYESLLAEMLDREHKAEIYSKLAHIHLDLDDIAGANDYYQKIIVLLKALDTRPMYQRLITNPQSKLYEEAAGVLRMQSKRYEVDFRKMPVKQRRWFYSNPEIVMDAVRTYGGEAYVVALLKNTPPEYCTENLEYFKPFIKGLDKLCRGNLVRDASKIPSEHFIEFFSRIKPFLERKLYSILGSKIVRVTKQIPPERLGEFLEKISPLLRWKNYHDRANIMEVVEQIPQEYIEDFLIGIRSVLNDITEFWNRDRIFRVAAKIPPHSFKVVFEGIKPLLKGVKGEGEKARIIMAACKIPMEYWASFFEGIKPFLTGAKKEYLRGNMIAEASQVPAEHFKEFFVELEQMAAELPNVTTYKIISAASKVTPGRFKEVFQETKALFGDANAQSILNVIIATHEVPLEYRKAFLTGVKSLLTEINYTSDLYDVIRIVSKIKPECFEKFFTGVKSLLGGIQKKYTRCEILRAVARIPADKLTSFFTKISPFLEGVVGESERESLILAACALPLEYWVEFFTKVDPLLAEIKVFARYRAVFGASKIPVENFSEFFTILKPLLVIASSDCVRYDVMKAVIAVPTAHMEVVVAKTIEYLKNRQNINIVQAIEAIKKQVLDENKYGEKL